MIQQQTAEASQILFDLLLTGTIGSIVVPVLTLLALESFLRWSAAVSRGDSTLGDLVDDAEELRRSRRRE